MGTGMLIIIPGIPGEAFIWRFQRIYPFPASRMMRKPYSITDVQARQLQCVIAASQRELTSAPSKSEALSFQATGFSVRWEAKMLPFEPRSSRQLGPKMWTTGYHRHSTEFWHCGAKLPLLKKAAQLHIMCHGRKLCTNLLQRVYWGPIHHFWSPTTLI